MDVWNLLLAGSVFWPSKQTQKALNVYGGVL